MLYRFCKNGLNDKWGEWVELDFPNRSDVTHWVYDHMDELQTFSVYESGNICGYAVELSEKSKPIAILYSHKISELIWIDMS